MREKGISDRDRIRVRFCKTLDRFAFEGSDYGPYRINDSVILPKKIATKLIENKIALIHLERMSVKDIVYCFTVTDFGDYFERNKILGYLQSNAEVFAEAAKKAKKCPNCGNAMIPKSQYEKGALRKYQYCTKCGSIKKVKTLLGSKLEDWAIVSSIQNIFHGKMTNEVKQSLVTEATNTSYDFGIERKIPANGTLIENPKRIAEKLEEFNALMILLIGGLAAKKLQIDDLFERRKKKKLPEGLTQKKKTRRKQGGFFYPIHSVDEDTRFSVDVYTSENRNKPAYGIAFMKIMDTLRPGSLIICRGDKLASMEQAAKKYLPRGVILDFQKRPYYFENDKEKKHPFYDKGPLIIIERRNKDLRKTIHKRQRNQRLSPLKTRISISKIGGNYVRSYFLEELTESWEARPYYPEELRRIRAKQKSEREAAMKLRKLTPKEVSKPLVRSAAQMAGIPYPFEPWNWRLFLTWVDWVHSNVARILNEGLK